MGPGGHVPPKICNSGLVPPPPPHSLCPISKDAHLRSISQTVPKNAKYTSPLIQNEVIQVMAEMVQEVIVNECKNSDIGAYCIKCDETRDAVNIVDMSVVLRYVLEGVAKERLLSLAEMEAVDAESIKTALLCELQHHSLDPVRILTQCYDGASVMSGAKGGVQKLVQDAIGKQIPYVYIASITSCTRLSRMQWRVSQRLEISLLYANSCTSFLRDSLHPTFMKARR